MPSPFAGSRPHLQPVLDGRFWVKISPGFLLVTSFATMTQMSTHANSERDSCYASGMLTVEQALSYVLERARPVSEIETIAVEAALGRVTAEDQRSVIDVPGHDNSSMDGYALRSADASAAGSVRLAVTQRIAAGNFGLALNPGESARIFTGAPLPPESDAVVMQEDCTVAGDWVTLNGPISPGQHVRPRGNNIAANDVVLAQGTRIRPQEMGIASAVGLRMLPVFRKLRVAFFSSGDELLNPGEPLSKGKIYNSNRFSLLGLLSMLGCETVDLGIVEDDRDRTEAVLRQAASLADVIITSGGVSVGEEDHVKRAVDSIGRLEMWRVAVKPGKPLAYGRIEEADFIGLPGNPVSTVVTFCLFVRPFLLRRQGVAEVLTNAMPVVADFDWPTAANRREYVRAKLVHDERLSAKAIIHPKQGSDVLASTVWADGLVEIPERSTVSRGDTVSYFSFSSLLC